MMTSSLQTLGGTLPLSEREEEDKGWREGGREGENEGGREGEGRESKKEDGRGSEVVTSQYPDGVRTRLFLP